jgi:hypothetical protein
MKKLIFHLATCLILFWVVLSGCSRSKTPDQAKEGKKTSTEQAADAIKEFGAKPIEKARTAQQMGEERTRAVDNAIQEKQ